MSSIKNPQGEAQNPAPMPREQQGQGGTPRQNDLAGQQGGTHGKAQTGKARMAPRSDAPPGLEQDGQGNTIPINERLPEDQEKARAHKPKD